MHPQAARVVAQLLTRVVRQLGGKGSGNFGHAGRPGERGGSSDAPGTTDRPVSSDLQGKIDRLAKLSIEADEEENWMDSVRYDAIKTVLVNQQKADKDPSKAKTSYFGYVLDTSVPAGVAAAVHAQDKNGQIELKWAGSLKAGKGKELIDRVVSWAKERGATHLVGTAKWGSIEYYKKMYGDAVEEGEEDPMTASVPFKIDLREKRMLGGPGSGNFGHGGRPGERGGSASEKFSREEGVEKQNAQERLRQIRESRKLRPTTEKQIELDDFVEATRYVARAAGGSGSGNYGHSGRPGERGGSAEARTDAERAARALKAHNPFSRKKDLHATKNEGEIVAMLRGAKGTQNNLPVDVVWRDASGKLHGIEVKTMLDNKASKITVRKDALARKLQWAKQNRAIVHTVVIDDRDAFGRKELHSGHRLYYQKGTGSFRLQTMTKVSSAKQLANLLRGAKK